MSEMPSAVAEAFHNVIEANRSVYDELQLDMFASGVCYLKIHADGTLERIDPARVIAPMVEA